MNIKKHIPNTITILNLLFGTVAVIFALKGWQLFAVYLILAAAVMDFLDGFMARLLKAYSPIGKELDSLADLISFGLAPSFLLYYRYSVVISTVTSGGGFSIFYELLALSPLIITAASALRLAKFNVDTRQSINFIGLPTPANAILISMLIHYNVYNSTLDNIISNLFFIPILSVVLSYFLISNISMFSLKFKSLNFGENRSKYLFALFAFALAIPVIVTGSVWSLWLFLVFASYILFNLISHFYRDR
ncbi:MAG: CDP-alcohol phosphatidyltransferase family protein [Bacteroidales bacterium]|nr:CDP-alcohol phosphatidyltransferase family protein [Bacteroidales bacterium]